MMKKKGLALLLFFLFALMATPIFAQKKGGGIDLKKFTKEEKDQLATAEYFYNDQENYERALPLYVGLMNAHKDIDYLKLRAAICYIYDSDDKQNAISLLMELKQKDPSIPDLDFYLGRAYHVNYKFEEAIAAFNAYLATNPTFEQKQLTNHYIENCKNAKVFVGLAVKGDIENIGDVINTPDFEYVPVVSSDESVLIYTYRGPRSTGGLMDDNFNPDPNGNYYEDVFISHRVGDSWLTPESIGTNINTKNHDASIALSADGQQLFLFHSTEKDGGDIYISKLKGDVWGVPEPLGPNINTKYWEGSCSLSADEKTLYFASERPGGLGGKDIYFSKRQPDGSWGTAQNLGPEINTEFNEDAPFIHPDGVTLFFSSEGHNSMGGYDIMYSTLKDGHWTEPVNMGYPINTTEDERYYVLTADGEHGYYSSNKKGGKGNQDIYTVTPGFVGEKPILALVVGTVTVDDNPVDATIRVTNAETGEQQGAYHSNSASGKYLIALTPGNNYKVAIEVEGFESQIQYVNIKSLDTYVQVTKDFKFTSPGTGQNSGLAVAQDSSNILQMQINAQIRRYNEERKAEVYEARIYQDLLRKYGEVKKECVSYAVELGTYEKAADFDPSKVNALGVIKSSVDQKGNTTYLIDDSAHC